MMLAASSPHTLTSVNDDHAAGREQVLKRTPEGESRIQDSLILARFTIPTVVGSSFTREGLNIQDWSASNNSPTDPYGSRGSEPQIRWSQTPHFSGNTASKDKHYSWTHDQHAREKTV